MSVSIGSTAVTSAVRTAAAIIVGVLLVVALACTGYFLFCTSSPLVREVKPWSWEGKSTTDYSGVKIDAKITDGARLVDEYNAHCKRFGIKSGTD